MRVKIGNDWYAVSKTQPIMIELTEQDKLNLASMHPDATKYACFDDDDPILVTKEQKLAWMEA